MNIKSILGRLLVGVLLIIAAGLFKPVFAVESTHPHTDQGHAMAHCSSDGAARVGYTWMAGTTQWSVTAYACTAAGTTQSPKYRCSITKRRSTDGFTSSGWSCVVGSENFAAAGADDHPYPEAATCGARPLEWDWLAPDPVTNPEQKVCYNGCTYKAYEDSTQGTYFTVLAEDGNSILPVCTTDEFSEPEDDIDGDGVPDEDDAFPNDPNETTDSDGDGIGDNADFSPDDPTDGQDTPGEEDGDDEGDNIAAGGGTCDAQPTCSGDGIQCAQLYQQWKIACKGASVSGAPEVCGASYTCTGDSAQCAQIALLRKTACTEVITDPGSDAAETILEGLQGGPTDQNLNPMSVWASEDDLELDDSGFGLVRSCPPPVQVFGKTISPTGLCDLGSIIAAIVLLMAFAHFAWAFTQ